VSHLGRRIQHLRGSCWSLSRRRPVADDPLQHTLGALVSQRATCRLTLSLHGRWSRHFGIGIADGPGIEAPSHVGVSGAGRDGADPTPFPVHKSAQRAKIRPLRDRIRRRERGGGRKRHQRHVVDNRSSEPEQQRKEGLGYAASAEGVDGKMLF
jgi:hypothetical protein